MLTQLYFHRPVAHFFGRMKRILMLAGLLGLAASIAVAAETRPVLTLLEKNILCVRLPLLNEGISGFIQSAPPTNALIGTVLDLRFADGDSQSVNEAVKLFSVQKSPLMILVNAQTRGGAAELAARLRTAHTGLLIGAEFKNLPPDITVTARLEDEKKFQENPLADLRPEKMGASAVTNDFIPFIDHMSEAELVRKRIKDGEEGDARSLRAEAPPVIRDPALARAVDLIRALAVTGTSRH